MPNKKQKVKIFRRKYGKHPKTGKHALLESLEQVINNFLKENPDHRITFVRYSARHDEWQSECALVVFDVTESSTGSGGGGGKPKPTKPKGKPRKREPSSWDEGSWVARSDRMREQHKQPRMENPARRMAN